MRLSSEACIEALCFHAWLPFIFIILSNNTLIGFWINCGLNIGTLITISWRAKTNTLLTYTYNGSIFETTLFQLIFLYLQEFLFHTCNVIFVFIVPWTQVSFFIFDNIEISSIWILTCNNLNLLLGIKTWWWTVKWDQVVFLFYTIY